VRRCCAASPGSRGRSSIENSAAYIAHWRSFIRERRQGGRERGRCGAEGFRLVCWEGRGKGGRRWRRLRGWRPFRGTLRCAMP
jgi:hypothetical protein